jgi:hypothetical protein
VLGTSLRAFQTAVAVRIGPTIIGGAVLFYGASLAVCFATLEISLEELLPLEKSAALWAGTILAASGLVRFGSFFFKRTGPTMADIAMLATNAIACSSNLLMGFARTPILVDTITGTSEYMVRWCEWTTLAFLMTFAVEAVSSRDVREPLTLAVVMGASAGCGLVFPFCTSPNSWGLWMMISFATYFALFPRYARRRRLYAEAVASCSSPSDVELIVSAKVCSLSSRTRARADMQLTRTCASHPRARASPR